MHDPAIFAGLIDTHCHLDFDSFDADRSDVIARAVACGVSRMLNPSVDLENSAKVIRLGDEYEPVFCAVGVHPNDCLGWNPDSVPKLMKLARSQKVVAIGEIGLDYYWEKTPKDLQLSVFQAQLEMAAELGLPVIVHNREAGKDVLDILLKWQASLEEMKSPLASRPGVLHSFSGDHQMASKAVAANFFIGLTGPLTFKNAKGLQELSADLPLDHLLVETDSPFLSPHPERGQRNEPAKVKLVAEKLAELKGIEYGDVEVATTSNAERLFHFADHQ